MRYRLLMNAGLLPLPVGHKPSLKSLRVTEWNAEFERLQRNRLLIGAIRYGSITRESLGNYDLMKSIRDRLSRYDQTGNKECLVDAANLLMYEFTFNGHPNAHFEAEDDTLHCASLTPEKT